MVRLDSQNNLIKAKVENNKDATKCYGFAFSRSRKMLTNVNV